MWNRSFRTEKSLWRFIHQKCLSAYNMLSQTNLLNLGDLWYYRTIVSFLRASILLRLKKSTYIFYAVTLVLIHSNIPSRKNCLNLQIYIYKYLWLISNYKKINCYKVYCFKEKHALNNMKLNVYRYMYSSIIVKANQKVNTQISHDIWYPFNNYGEYLLKEGFLKESWWEQN